jgi:hypothetical protein
MPRHKLTTEERSRGGLTRAAKMRAARELADERLSDLLEKALDRLALLLDSEDDMVAVRAAREVFDRVLGKSTQRHEHSGTVEIDIATARSKVDSLIERRAKEMARTS